MMRFVYLAHHILFAGAVLAVTLLTSGRLLGQHGPTELNQTSVNEAVEALAAVVDQEYFDRDVAARIAQSLREKSAEGRYTGVRTLKSLAKMLTEDLFQASKDKHLAVSIVQDRSATPELSDQERQLGGRRTNFGVKRVEVLAGNIGYLNLTAFYRLNEARDVISAAMRLLQSTDALILDLRENSGGSPDTVALLASHFFETPGLALFEIIPRSGTGGGQYTTFEPAVPERNESRPIYVLTSKRTFSAGEGLAFILQQRDRAEIVGEQTAGAANPGRPYAVNEYLEATIPNGQVRVVASDRNWEGVGVLPDVTVPAADALHCAHFRALHNLLTQTPTGPWHDALNRHLNTLETEHAEVLFELRGESPRK